MFNRRDEEPEQIIHEDIQENFLGTIGNERRESPVIKGPVVSGKFLRYILDSGIPINSVSGMPINFDNAMSTEAKPKATHNRNLSGQDSYLEKLVQIRGAGLLSYPERPLTAASKVKSQVKGSTTSVVKNTKKTEDHSRSDFN